ncbi:hypothetical protein ACW14Y_05185 [Kitasatospora sp. cg17-2]
MEGVGDLLAVCAGVLDRSCADGAGYPGQALDAGQLFGGGPVDEVGERVAGLTVTATVVPVSGRAVMPRVFMTTTVPGWPASAAITLLPCPRTRGPFCSWVLIVRAASSQSAGSERLTTVPTGPPSRRVVSGASVAWGTAGPFSRR